MITKETFIDLVTTIRDNGTVSDFQRDGIAYRSYEVSELTLVISRAKNSWIPEGISFQLFGEDFFVTPDGNITLSDTDDEEVPEFYTLQDSTLIAIVSSFLKWRLNVLKKAQV